MRSTPNRILAYIRPHERVAFLYSLVIPFILSSLYMTQHLPDRNFDRRMAYEYNVIAFFENRYQLDWMPSGLSTYINPFINIPILLLSKLPDFFSFVYGFTIMFFYILGIWKIVPYLGINRLNESLRLKFSLVTISAFSPHFLAELGTGLSNYTSGIFLVYGMLFFLKGNWLDNRKSFFASGFYFMLAVNFKMVNALALVALMPCFLLLKTTRFRMFVSFALGATLAAVCFLPWFLFVLVRTGSPVYPLLNSFFNAAYYPSINFRDGRWHLNHPEKALQFVSGLWGRINSEIIAFDVRIPVVFLLLFLVFTTTTRKRLFELEFRPTLILALWLAFFAALWGNQFFMARYFMPGELFLGLILTVLVLELFGAKNERHKFLNSLVILCLLTMVVPNWNSWQEPNLDLNKHVSIRDSRWQFPSNIHLPEKSQVLVLGEPLSYTFQFFPRSTSFINIGWPEYATGEKIELPKTITQKIVARGVDNVFLTPLPLDSDEGRDRAQYFLSKFNLVLDEKRCKSFMTVSDTVWLCKFL